MADYGYDDTDDYFDLEDEDTYGLGSLWNDEYDGYGQDYENDDFAEEGEEGEEGNEDDEAAYANESYHAHLSSEYLSSPYLGDPSYYSREKHLASSVREYHPPSYSNNMGSDGYAMHPPYLGDGSGYSYGMERYYARNATGSTMHPPESYPEPPLRSYPYPYPNLSALSPPVSRSATHLAHHHMNSEHSLGTAVYPTPPYGRPRSISHDVKPVVPPIVTTPRALHRTPHRAPIGSAPRQTFNPPITTMPQPASLIPSQSQSPFQPRSAGPIPTDSENFQGDGPASLAIPADRRDSSVRRTKSLSKPLSSMANNAMSVPRRGLSKLKSGFRGRTLTRHGFRDKSRSRSGSPVRD